MVSFESLSSKIGSKMASTLNMDKDKEEAIAYGAFALLQTIWTIIWVILVSKTFGVLYEALMILATISILRKYSGGAHATSPNRCVVIGTMATVGFAVVINKIFVGFNAYIVFFLGIVSLAVSYPIVYKLAPVDSPAKPIVKLKTKQRLKKCSIVTITILLVVMIIIAFFYVKYSTKFLLRSMACIYVGILWQSFTLTSKGHKVVNEIDSTLKMLCNRR